MYRKSAKEIIATEKFEFGKLSADNRWVVMAKQIPWTEFEEEYAKNFSDKDHGAPAKSFRMALGALIIKERLGMSDIETVEQIKENPYLQYFLGMSTHSNEALFDASMLVHFRKRIDGELMNKINRKMVKNNVEMGEEIIEKKSR